MSVYSEQSEPVVGESALKKMVSALRHGMTCRNPKRILAASVLAVGSVAAILVIAVVLTRDADDYTLRETDFTTIIPPSSTRRVVTEIVPKTTRSDPTRRSSTRASILSTTSPETSQATARTSPSTSETKTTEFLSTSKISTTTSPPLSTATTKLLTTTTTSTTTEPATTSTTTEPTTTTEAATTSTSQPTTRSVTYERKWKQFLEPELNTECNCEGCSNILDEDYAEMQQIFEEPHEYLWLLNKPQVGASCAVIKSMPSAYFFPTSVLEYAACEYNKTVLSEYYTRYPELMFPRGTEETWGIPENIANNAKICENVIAMKQCRELPPDRYFARCRDDPS